VGVGMPSDVAGASLSRDGTLVVYDSAWQATSLGDRNASSDVFIRRANGTHELLSQAHAIRRSASPAAHTGLSPASISGDGRFIVATRDDDPSFGGDTNRQPDVFLTDLNTGVSHAISTAVRVTTNSGGGAFQTNSFLSTNGCFMPVISANGSTIAAIQRISYPANTFDVVLTRGTNGIFALGMESLRDTLGVFSGSYFSPSLTSDGRLLAFASTATGVTPEPDANGTGPDIFVRYDPTDHESNAFLISRSTNGLTGNMGATNPVITPDGRWVTFISQASTLVHPALPHTNAVYPSFTVWPYNAPQLFAADLGTNQSSTNFLRQFSTRLCSYTIVTNRGGSSFPDPSMSFTTLRPLDAQVVRAVTSANGRYVVFATANPASIYRHDLNGWRTNWFEELIDTGGQPTLQLASGLEPGALNSLVCEGCSNPSVSADGNSIAYEKPRVGMPGYDVYVTDVHNGTTTLANATLTGVPANGSSIRPVISGDGRYVVFQSKASDLVLNDTNGFTDIFVRDRQLGQTLLVSANLLLGSGNGPSSSPVLGMDGRTVVFRSAASDLVPDDFNDRRDLMVLKLGGADSDSDALDDQWEVAFFGDLGRTGAADYDADGVTDRDEFLAGTDPTNSVSVFKLLVLSTAQGGSRRLFWSGDSSRSYRIEYKDDLNSPSWSGLNSTITWSGAAAAATDNSPGTNRFYRVVRLP
jgi:TolB protein